MNHENVKLTDMQLFKVQSMCYDVHVNRIARLSCGTLSAPHRLLVVAVLFLVPLSASTLEPNQTKK